MTLKEWRIDKGLSQHAAGTLMGWSQSTYQRIESGETPANRDHLATIHMVTDGAVTPNDVVLGDAAA